MKDRKNDNNQSSQSSEKRIKKIRTLHELFPDFTSPEQLEELDRWDRKTKKAKSEGTSDTIILPDNAGEIIVPEDFDIRALMAQAEDPLTGTMRNLRIDDRDLPHAKNYWDYSARIVGRDANMPWAKQMWTGLMLFGEICTACTKPSRLQIENIPKDFDSMDFPKKFALLEHGVCPKCKRTKWDLIKNHNMMNYLEVVNVWGQRSGKSSTAFGGFSPYIAHQYLKFPALPTLAPKSMQASTELTASFVSLTTGKAVGVMWVPFKKHIEDSTWWKEYFKILDDSKAKYGVELYRRSTLYLKIFHRNMHFYPTGPRSSVLRGDTRIFCGLDELGLFPLPQGDSEEDTESERANADEAHKSLMNSLLTVQTVRLKLLKQGYHSVPWSGLMSVSSPFSLRDKVMRLLRQSRTDVGRTTILGTNVATWDINPDIDRDNPVIVSAYAANAEKAERDYGANPPAVHSRYMPINSFRNAFTGGQNSHNWQYIFDQPEFIYGKIDRIRTYRWPSIVSIDAGSVDNSFTLTGMHYDFNTNKTVVTTILECMPQEGRRVNFNKLYEHVILPLLKDLRAVGLFADQWQSIDILNRAQDDMGLNPLQKPRCKSVQHSPRRKDFDAVRAMLTAGNVILPTVQEVEAKFILEGGVANFKQEMVNKPVQHLMLQMSTVKDIGEGRCPTKGDDMTDDIFRALVLGIARLHHPKVMAALQEAKDWTYDGQSNGARMPMPVFVGRSGSRIWPGMR
jgi:hypothetical protein